MKKSLLFAAEDILSGSRSCLFVFSLKIFNICFLFLLQLVSQFSSGIDSDPGSDHCSVNKLVLLLLE